MGFVCAHGRAKNHATTSFAHILDTVARIMDDTILSSVGYRTGTLRRSKNSDNASNQVVKRKLLR